MVWATVLAPMNPIFMIEASILAGQVIVAEIFGGGGRLVSDKAF
jgi:hypothetical protein